jgi:hypothetical protein
VSGQTTVTAPTTTSESSTATPLAPADLNATLYATARAWAADLDLTIGQIDVADVFEYDVLRIFGRLLQQDAAKNEVIGDGRISI